MDPRLALSLLREAQQASMMGPMSHASRDYVVPPQGTDAPLPVQPVAGTGQIGVRQTPGMGAPVDDVSEPGLLERARRGLSEVGSGFLTNTLGGPGSFTSEDRRLGLASGLASMGAALGRGGIGGDWALSFIEGARQGARANQGQRELADFRREAQSMLSGAQTPEEKLRILSMARTGTWTPDPMASSVYAAQAASARDARRRAQTLADREEKRAYEEERELAKENRKSGTAREQAKERYFRLINSPTSEWSEEDAEFVARYEQQGARSRFMDEIFEGLRGGQTGYGR